MRRLSRYILRQLAAPFVFALAAMTGIMMVNQIAKQFGLLVGKDLPWSVIGEVLLLSLPFIVAMTLPMAVLMAVLYAFTALAGANEITAMRASGVSVSQILRPVLVAAVLLTLADFAFLDQGLPAANLRLSALRYDIGRKRPTLSLNEETLNVIPPSTLFLRAGRISAADGRLRDVTIYDMSGQQGRQVIYADSGQMRFAPNQSDLHLILHSGSILQFRDADPGLFQLTYFTTNTIRVKGVANELERSDGDVAKDDRTMSTCEMLDVVADSRRDLDEQRRLQATRAESDLRVLLELPQASHPTEPPDSITGSRWCAGLRALGRRILPETAEAQRAAQDPASLPGRKRQALRERVRAIRVDSTRPAAPPTATAPQAASAPARPAPLTGWVDAANTAEALRNAGKVADRYLVEVHKKYAISVACLVFVLVGIPVALRFPRGGMGLVLGGGFGIFALYYVSLTGGEPLADKGFLSPALAMWAPNLLFGVAGLIGLLRVNRELGSTRGGDAAELLDLLRRGVLRWRRRP